jgi:hypothetical protein
LLKILAAGKTSHEKESMDRLINPGKLFFNKLHHLQENVQLREPENKNGTDLVYHRVKDFSAQQIPRN